MKEVSPSPRAPLSVQLNVFKQLWPKQKDAVSFTLKQRMNFLAMEMGTGKTITTLASLAIRHHWGSVDVVLIICPAAAVHVWQREIDKWLPGTTLRFCIMSIGTARIYFKYLKLEQFDALVVDEIHRLKNPNSSQSRRLYKIARSIPYRYGLTGTQIADSVIDLFGQYRTVAPGPLGDDWIAFREKFLYRGGFMGREWKIDKNNKQKVLKLVEPCTFQVTKKEMFPDRKVSPPVYIYAQLKGTQKKLYHKLEQDLIAKHGDFTITTKRAITKMIRLQQITGGHCPSDKGEMLTFECGKAEALREFLQGWDREKKLVIFARYRYELDLIKNICTKLKFTSRIYSSSTPKDEDDFQAGKFDVFILQIDGGGIALTLTIASTAVFFSKTFSWLTFAQALSRVDRGGQDETVTPIFLVTQGTIDEDVEMAVEEKENESSFVKRFMASLKKRLTKD